MAMAALSPNSVLASPIQVNPQITADLQSSVPQGTQDAQKAAKAVQTDTVTISSQALKMADDKNAVAKETARKKDEQQALQLANNKADADKSSTQRNAVKAYASVSANQ
ncbi:MAG: hypothetical protein PHH28_01970 [Desulfuromonadaceae bacterium]|nr:hypothetical protein [Desulfuromonadaceae bacterium]